jgi:hypothetical protein
MVQELSPRLRFSAFQIKNGKHDTAAGVVDSSPLLLAQHRFSYSTSHVL